jgi:uncharacterized membrane protein YhfC
MPLYPILFGAATFFIFVIVLENAVNSWAISKLPITSTAWLYILYVVLAAGIFEETGRLISFTVIERITKKPKTPLTGVSYGLGHGGFEAILLVGLTMLNNIILSVINNAGSLPSFYQSLPEELQLPIANAVTILYTTPPLPVLIGGIERAIAIAAQLAFSVIMFYAVFAKRKIWLYPVAILCHILTNIPAALYQTGILKNLVLTESITAFIAAAVIVFAVWINDKYKGSLNGDALPPSGVAEAAVSVTVADDISENAGDEKIAGENESEPDIT